MLKEVRPCHVVGSLRQKRNTLGLIMFDPPGCFGASTLDTKSVPEYPTCVASAHWKLTISRTLKLLQREQNHSNAEDARFFGEAGGDIFPAM